MGQAEDDRQSVISSNTQFRFNVSQFYQLVAIVVTITLAYAGLLSKLGTIETTLKDTVLSRLDQDKKILEIQKDMADLRQQLKEINKRLRIN